MNRTRSLRRVAYLPLRGVVVALNNRQGTPRVYPVIHNFRSYPGSLRAARVRLERGLSVFDDPVTRHGRAPRAGPCRARPAD